VFDRSFATPAESLLGEKKKNLTPLRTLRCRVNAEKSPVSGRHRNVHDSAACDEAVMVVVVMRKVYHHHHHQQRLIVLTTTTMTNDYR
jgi:hypothetical protein